MATVVYEPPEGPGFLEQLASGMQPGIEKYFEKRQRERVTQKMQESIDDYRQQILDSSYKDAAEARAQGPSLLATLPSEVISNPAALKLALDWQDKFLVSQYPDRQAYVDAKGNVVTDTTRPEGSLTAREYGSVFGTKASQQRAASAGTEDARAREVRRIMQDTDASWRGARNIYQERSKGSIKKGIEKFVKEAALDQAIGTSITTKLTPKIEGYLAQGLPPEAVQEALVIEATDLLSKADVSALPGGQAPEQEASRGSMQQKLPENIQLKPGKQTVTKGGEVEQDILGSISDRISNFFRGPQQVQQQQAPAEVTPGRFDDIPDPPGYTTIGHLGEKQVQVPEPLVSNIQSKEQVDELVGYIEKEYNMSRSEAANFVIKNLVRPSGG